MSRSVNEMTLKTKNTTLILGFIVIIYVGFAMANGLDWGFATDIQVSKEGVKLSDPLLTMGLHLLALLLSYILPPEFKHRIIYLRWNDPLPGSRIFSSLVDKDSRISRKELVKKYGKLPTDPVEQNKLWYKIYKTKQSDEVVLNSHGRWLLFRDIFSILLILIVPATCYTYWKSGVEVGSVYFGLAAVLLVFLWTTARNTGNRFACNVLAR
ncbi:MAG: hypothetical protein ACLP5H_03645 [Desulfomonilaceae bacterium]